MFFILWYMLVNEIYFVIFRIIILGREVAVSRSQGHMCCDYSHVAHTTDPFIISLVNEISDLQ